MLEGDARSWTFQCEKEAVYKDYCWQCAWVMLPEERALLPERVKQRKTREQSETSWAATLLSPFTSWKKRKAWPVGSVLVRRNNCGAWINAEGRPIKYGLGTGTADYVGFKSIVITPEMVGQRFAQFVSIEAKRRDVKLGPLQQLWFDTVALNGGIALRAAPETRAEVLRALR